MSRSRYPVPTTEQILKLREYCLAWEAEGNSPRGDGYTDNVDLRRGIIFYHSTAGSWHLYRDWREAFNEKYPTHAVDGESPLRKRKQYISGDELADLVKQLKEYDRTVSEIYFRRDIRRWVLLRIEYRNDAPHMRYEAQVWRNANDAYMDLNQVYSAFRQSCEVCGCDWRLVPRFKDEQGWRCECGTR